MANESPYTRHGDTVLDQRFQQQTVDVYGDQTPFWLSSEYLGEWRDWRDLLEANEIGDPFDLTEHEAVSTEIKTPVEDFETGLDVLADFGADGWPEPTIIDSNSRGEFIVNTYGENEWWGFEFAISQIATSYLIDIKQGVLGSVLNYGFSHTYSAGETTADVVRSLALQLQAAGLRVELVPGESSARVWGFKNDEAAGPFEVSLLGTGLLETGWTLDVFEYTLWKLSLRRDIDSTDHGPEYSFPETDFYDRSGDPLDKTVTLYTADRSEFVTFSFDADTFALFYLAIDLGISVTANATGGELVIPARELQTGRFE